MSLIEGSLGVKLPTSGQMQPQSWEDFFFFLTPFSVLKRAVRLGAVTPLAWLRAVAPKRSGVLDRHAQDPPPASQPSVAGSGSHRRGNAARAMVNEDTHEFAALPAPATAELGGEDQ